MGSCAEDINKPSVDNTPLLCDPLLSTDCVLVSQAIPYLGIAQGDTLTQALLKIKNKLYDIQSSL